MTRARRLLVALTLTAGLAPAATAQQSPHGKLPDGVDCSDCHTPKSWKPEPGTVKFDHNRMTSFQLLDRHRSVACRSCHLSVKFDEPTLKGADCATCHADVHRGAYTERCSGCHTSVSFTDMPALQIHARTTFPLTGAHAMISCRTCHVDDRAGAFTPLDPQCYSCHQTAYETASPVDHVAGNYPTDCLRCHTTIAWTANVRFDHASVAAGFRLLGAHARIRCESCHNADMTPKFTPANDQDCIACHSADHQQAHPTFPTNCLACHTVETWADVNVDHAAIANGFQLLGAHARIPCSSCHAADWTPLYQPANDQDCIACHQADYDREHAGSGFPTTCLTCHTTDSWGGASFTQHDPQYFPIYSGRHAGTWQNCQTCHTQAGNFAVFSCFACHGQSETDGRHRDVANYSYDSNRCYQCHPRGTAGGG